MTLSRKTAALGFLRQNMLAVVFFNHCQFSNAMINYDDIRLTECQCLLKRSCKREPSWVHAMHGLRLCQGRVQFLLSGQLAVACRSEWRRSLHLWRIWQRLPLLFEMWQIEMYCKNTLAEQVFRSVCICSVLSVSYLNFYLHLAGGGFPALMDFRCLCFQFIDSNNDVCCLFI